jgi:hypothetical protein
MKAIILFQLSSFCLFFIQNSYATTDYELQMLFEIEDQRSLESYSSSILEIQILKSKCESSIQPLDQLRSCFLYKIHLQQQGLLKVVDHKFLIARLNQKCLKIKYSKTSKENLEGLLELKELNMACRKRLQEQKVILDYKDNAS